eukprot:6459237-Amphidinium_carterae.1
MLMKPPHTQRCVGGTPGIDAPLLALDQLVSCCSERQLSLSLVFVDLSAAFDNVIHDLLFPPEDITSSTSSSQDNFHHMLHRISRGDPRHETAATYLQQHPTILLNNHIPPSLLRTLRSWLHSWMITQQDWERARKQLAPSEHINSWSIKHITNFRPTISTETIPTIHTTQGVKQGDPLSTYLFTAYLNLAIHYIDSHFHERNTHHVTCHIPTRTTRLLPADDDQVDVRMDIPHLEYADDILYPLCHRNPITLLQSTRLLINTLVEGFQHFGLQTNFKPNKTGLLLQLRGAQ